jgi:hypothetical protein
MSTQRLSLVLVFGIGLSLTLADVASAQRGGRGRGFFGFGVSRVQLATLDEVQSNLKLSDAQKASASDIGQKVRDERRAAFQGGGGGDFAARREQMQKINDDADAKLVALLDEGQQKRLTEIYVQVNGTNALSDVAVAKALQLSEDQQQKLAAARDENRESMRESFQGFRDMSNEERQEAVAKFRKEADERLLAALTDEQREQFGKLKGEELEIDMSQLRRGGRRQGGGGQGGRPGRPE